MPELDINYLKKLQASYTPNIPLAADPSRHDGSGFLIDNYASEWDTNIRALEESRAQNQGTFDKLGLGLGRVTNKIAVELASVPGYLVGLGEAAFTDKTLGESLNSSYLNAIKEYEHYVNENQLKVYTPESVKNGNLLDNLGSASFWATEGADGVGFLVSMLVPGNALKLAKLGTRTGKATYGLGMAIEGTNVISKTGSKMFKTAGNFMYKNADDILAAGTNAVIEGAAEAREAYESTLNSLMQKYGGEENLSEDQLQELKVKAGEAASDVFKYNLGILSVSNLFDQANLFGAFSSRKTMLGKMFSGGKLLSKDDIIKTVIGKGFKDGVTSGLKSVGAGLLKEGFYEEGMQFAASALAESQALEDDKYNNIFEAYVNNLSNIDMQKGIALGGILGGGMSSIGNYLENKRTKSALFGSEEIKRNKFQKLLGLQNVEKSFGLYDYINTSLSEREQSLLSAFEKDETTGELKLNKSKALDLINKLEEKSVLNTLLNLAVVSEDKLTYERLKNMMDYQYFSNFFKYGEEGLKILKEHISNDLVGREKQKYETNELLGMEKTSDAIKIASELNLKADQFFEIYNNNNELHKIEFPSNLKGGDKNTFNEFSDSIRRKKQDHALIDFINNKFIKDIDNDLFKLDLNTEAGRKQAENLNKQKEELKKINDENQRIYKDLFNKEKLQSLYDEYVISKNSKNESDVKTETSGTESVPTKDLTDDQINEEYLKRLKEAGYNVEGSREQPVYFQIGSDGYIANTAIGGKARKLFNAKTGKQVGIFDSAYYKRNREKIQFVPREEAEKLRKRRKTIELRKKQYNALVNIAFNTKNEFDSLSEQITERINKREELLDRIEEEKQELKKVTNEYGVARKGYGEIKKLVLSQIKELENEINSLNEDIEILELYREDLQETLESVEAYKQELQSMSLDEQFLFTQELRELESFESQPERLDENTLLDQIINDLTKTINSNIDLREELIKQRDVLKNILDVYKNFYSMSIADKLLINTKISENKYQSLLQKYPFLESYKRSQMMFFYKLKNKIKVKEFDTWQDYNENRILKKNLYSNIENFVNENPISLFGIPLNSVSIEEAVNLVAEDIANELQGLSKVSEDIENIEQHLNEAKAIEEEFNIVNEEIKRLEDIINKIKNEYQNAKRLKDITDLSKKKLKFLKDNINEIAVQINKINVQAKDANAANTADNGDSDYRQQPPIEEVSKDDFEFRDPFLSNQILRSIFPEVLWDKDGKYIFNEDGSPKLNEKLNIRTISKFLNSNKDKLREGQYSVKFYIPDNSKTPSNINELFKSEYPEASSKDIGFVIVDKNGEVVKEELDGVERTVYGFIPKSMEQETSPNKLRINDNALLQKYLSTFKIYIADPIKSLKVDSLGFITNDAIVKQVGKVKLNDLISLAQNWVDEYYQNNVKKTITDHIEKNDNTYLDIIGVTQGLMLKSNKLKNVQSVFGEGKVKIISLEDSTDKELGGFSPGTIIYETGGERFPLIQRTLTTDEIETLINSIYLGWVDSTNGPFAGNSQEFGKNSKGEDKYIIVKSKEQKSYRYYPGANSNISIISSLIYWGQYKREFYTGQDGKKIPGAGKHKGEIFVESGILYFKDPNNNLETLTGISLKELGKAIQTGTVFTSSKFQNLIKFLSNKRLNVNKELLSNKGLFFYPSIKVKDGKIVTTYETFTNYQEFLLKGKSNAPSVLSTTATSKNTANRQIIFDTNLESIPKLYSDKKKPEVKKETPKPIEKLSEEVKTSNINLDELNNTTFDNLPDGEYTIEGLKNGNKLVRNFVVRDKILYQANENSLAISTIELYNKNKNEYTFNFILELSKETPAITSYQITNYQPFKQEPIQESEDLDNELDELLNQQEPVDDIESQETTVNENTGISAEDLGFDSDSITIDDRVVSKKEYNKADITKEKQWLKDKLGLTDSEISIISGLIDGYSMGRFLSDGNILLSDIMEIGTAYHEAFHRVFQASLNNRQRQALIKEFKKQSNWESKLLDEYKHLPIDKQIEEVLAEEFRDYVLAEGQIFSQPIKQTVFDRIFNFIKKLLGLNTLTKEQLFEKINNGDFNKIKTRNNTYTQSDRITKVGDVELTPNEKSELFSAMNYYFFDGIFKVHENTSDNYFNTEINVKELYNVYVKNYIISDLKDAIKIFENKKQKAIENKNQDLVKALSDKLKRMNSIVNSIENNFNDLNSEFSKQLEYFGLKTKFETEIVEEENSTPDNIIETNSETENTSTGRTLDIISAVEFNTKDNLPNNFKMLIAALPDLDEAGNKKISSTLGLAQQANWGESVNILLNNLAGTPANIDFMIEKIQELSKKFPRYKTLIDYIGGDSKTFMSSKGFNNLNLVMLRREVVSALAKTKYNFVIARINENGDYVIQNANSEQVVDREINQAKTNIKQVFNNLGGKSNYENKLNEAFLSKDYVEGARLLGLDVKPEDLNKQVSNESVVNHLKQIYSLMSKNLNSDKFTIDAIYESKNEFAARKRIKDIVSVTFDLNENIELQLVNTEGKSVYSISLNTYQTLLVDGINFWIDKGKSKEERLNLLSKNIPHLINVHNQNSKWLNHLLEGNKLIYHLSDGIKNYDELQGEHLSSVTPTDLMSYMINSTLSGYFISNKHADRSMFPTYVFDSGWDPIGYNNNAVLTATDIMLGYLKDEVAKVKSLQRNSFYEDVAYYGKFDFKKSLFNGVIDKSLFDKLVNDSIKFDHADISTQIQKFLRSIVTKDKNTIESLGLLNSYDRKQNIGISNELTPFGFANVKTKERYGTIDKLIEHFSMMSYINHLEEFKLFNGDFSIYKDTADLNKRLNMQSSSGESLSVDNEINTYISNLNLDNTIKIDGEEFIYKDGEANGQIKEIIIQDFETISSVINEIADIYRKDLSKRLPSDKVEQEVKFLVKAYEAMVENDGLSYANIFSVREYSIRAGIWNNKIQNNFDLQLAYINNDESKIKELTTVPKNQKAEDWFNENFEAFVNLKPQYLGPNYIVDKESFINLPREDRHNIVAGRKTSYHPLIPMEIQGKVLETMNKFMLKNGIDFIHLGGAAKFGTKIQRPYYNIENSKTKGFNDSVLQESEIGYLDYQYMKNQVKISPENKVNITTSTQARINTVEGLINNGVPIDYKDGNWGSLTEDEKLSKSEIYKNLKEYENLQYELINSAIEDLLEEIGGVKVSDSYLIENIENFKNLLVNLAIDKNSPDNIIDTLNDFTNTNSFIELLPNSTKIQNILFSLISKRVIVEKRPGDMFPQAASTGYESGERTLTEGGKFTSNNEALKFFTFETDKDGVTKILPPEIIIPLPVKLLNNLLAKYKTKNIVDAVDLFNKDLQDGIAVVKVKGLRIPNQQLSSNDIFRVKKFGYPYLQANILVPTELVGKTGGDFDIDKVSVYYPNLDNDLQPVKYYDTHTDELFDQFLKNNKSEIYDEIQSDNNFKSFVSRLNNLKDRLASMDNKEANNAIIEYASSITGKESKNLSDALESIKNLKKSNRTRISEINDTLGKVYRENLDKAVEEKVYIENFKDLENERKSLQELNKLIDIQLTNFYELSKTNSKNVEEINKKLSSAVKAIRTRKANIKEEFREEFEATPVSKINSKQAKQNRMLEVEEALMLHPENLRNLLSPVADDELKAQAKTPEKALPNEIPSASYNLEATIRFLAGKAGVGILATWITFNSKAQINNLNLNPTFKALDEDGTEYSSSLPERFNIEDNKIGKIYNDFGTTVANALSAILTSQVDLVKNPYAKDINLTEQTLNVVSYLLVRGVNVKKVIEFITQPIIFKYLENQRLNESNVYKFTGKQSKFNPDGLVLSKDALVEKVSNEFKNQPIQQEYLKDYVLIVEQAKAINKVKGLMSPDTKTLKDKNDFKLYQQLKTEVKTQNIVENLDSVFEEGKLLSGFKKGKELYMELYKQFFFTENLEVVNSLDSFKQMLFKNIKGEDIKNKVSNTIDENLITYLIQTKSPLFKNKFDTLMKGDNSLAKTLYKIKNDQHPKSKLLKNNILIKALLPIIENKNSYGESLDNVKLVKSKMITFENNNMLDAFNKLMSIDSNLANNIVLFNILQSGFTNSPYQLSSIIPYNSLYVDIIKEANKIIKETNNYDELLQQYFKDFLASHTQYVPTKRQFNNRNYSGYPFYKTIDKKTGKITLTDGVNVFSPIGSVFGINYNKHVMSSNLQNIDNKTLDNQESTPVQKPTQSDSLNEVDIIKNEIKEYVKLLSKEKQQEAMEIIRNFGPIKTVSDYGKLKEKLCK